MLRYLLSRGRLIGAVVMFFAAASVNLHANELDNGSRETPEQVLSEYLTAVYSKDAVSAYALLSAGDKNVKSLGEYAEETAAFTGNVLKMSKALSKGVKMDNVQTTISDIQASVVFDASLPNANHPDILAMVHSFNSEKLSRMTSEEIDSLVDQIHLNLEEGLLPDLQSIGEKWQLVQENGQWRVFENWAGAVRVSFSGQTFEDLGWEFVPVKQELLVKHGETVHMKYIARNIGANESTGKARHILGPDENGQHLEIVGCFCFIEQTLSPGESVELPLVFRVNYDAPEDASRFTVKYEFYPIDKFPQDNIGHGGKS